MRFCSTATCLALLFLPNFCLIEAENNGGCMTSLAEMCFSDVIIPSDRICSDDVTASGNKSACLHWRAQHLCSTLNDSLQCTADIIQGECDYTATYNQWLAVLQTTLTYFCRQNASKMELVLEEGECGSLAQYIACIQRVSHTEHITDITTLTFSPWECSALSHAVTLCAVSPGCSAPHHASSDVASVLYTAAWPCHHTPSPSSPSSSYVTTVVSVLVACVVCACLVYTIIMTKCYQLPLYIPRVCQV